MAFFHLGVGSNSEHSHGNATFHGTFVAYPYCQRRKSNAGRAVTLITLCRTSLMRECGRALGLISGQGFFLRPTLCWPDWLSANSRQKHGRPFSRTFVPRAVPFVVPLPRLVSLYNQTGDTVVAGVLKHPSWRTCHGKKSRVSLWSRFSCSK